MLSPARDGWLLNGDSTDFLLLSAGGVPARSLVSQRRSITDCSAINVLEMDPLLVMGVIRLRRHDEGSEVVTLMVTALEETEGFRCPQPSRSARVDGNGGMKRIRTMKGMEKRDNRQISE